MICSVSIKLLTGTLADTLVTAPADITVTPSTVDMLILGPALILEDTSPTVDDITDFPFELLMFMLVPATKLFVILVIR